MFVRKFAISVREKTSYSLEAVRAASACVQKIILEMVFAAFSIWIYKNSEINKRLSDCKHNFCDFFVLTLFKLHCLLTSERLVLKTEYEGGCW